MSNGANGMISYDNTDDTSQRTQMTISKISSHHHFSAAMLKRLALVLDIVSGPSVPNKLNLLSSLHT
uniref:Uncharacterized protein n=1 Tax=Caenorhabditis japonica TaxID=281687 RepID=A0A8R1ILU0_CAEJA